MPGELMLSAWTLLAQSGVGGLTELLTGGGVTLTGGLIVALYYFASGRVHADKNVQKRYADYESQLKEANERAGKWEQRAWDAHQTTKSALNLAETMVPAAIDVSTNRKGST